MNNNGLGNFLRSQRLTSKKSQKAVADEAKVPQSVLSRIESGETKNPRPVTLASLAKVFGVTLDALISMKSGETDIDIEPFNIYPFIQALASSTSTTLSIEDLEFLVTTQRGLNQTMAPTLIDALITARKKKEEI